MCQSRHGAEPQTVGGNNLVSKLRTKLELQVEQGNDALIKKMDICATVKPRKLENLIQNHYL